MFCGFGVLSVAAPYDFDLLKRALNAKRFRLLVRKFYTADPLRVEPGFPLASVALPQTPLRSEVPSVLACNESAGVRFKYRHAVVATITTNAADVANYPAVSAGAPESHGINGPTRIEESLSPFESQRARCRAFRIIDLGG